MQQANRTQRLKPPFGRYALHLSLLSIFGAPFASAQGIFENLPGSPSGFAREVGPPEPMAEMETVLDKFKFRFNTSALYDTNVTQGSDLDDTKHGSFISGIGGDIAYQGKGSIWSYEAGYQFNYDQYFGDQSDLSGLNRQAGSASLRYEAARLALAGSTKINVSDGANRYYEGLVRLTTYSYNLEASYELSPKTSIDGGFDQSFSESSSNGTNDTFSTNLSLAALWRMSSLTRIGPGLRYTVRGGDDREDRYSLGPTINIEYKLTEKVSLTSRLGLDFVEYGGGESADPTSSASITATYRASALWGMNATFYRDSQADPTTPGAYDDVTHFKLGYYRQIRRATLNLAATYEVTESQSDSSSGYTRPNRSYFSFDSSISMPVLSNKVLASIFLTYRDRGSDDELDEWDSLQGGISLTTEF